ncbi:MAG: protein kinase [Gemmatales bacterium]|nr:protein kinase [Gemmatales bacterium]MDW8386247.1 protein kinase [Gemmatales bacterium]
MPRVVLNWVGKTIAGQYVIEAQLGEGGMGTVYRAFDQRRQHPVALKVPRIALLQDPAFFKRFEREMKALMELRHAHLVPVLDVGEHNHIPFLVMKYISGGNLRERFKKQRAGSLKDLFPWLSQVASALDFLHAEKLVHRDVKPDNVLFDEHGEAYLSDLGAVKVQEGSDLDAKTKLTATGMALGTPAYMAPEVLFGKPYDGRADQYALAVMVYEAFAGHSPYPADSLPTLVQSLMGPEPERLDRVCGAPTAVAEAVARAMSREPTQRFSSCSEFAEAIRTGFSRTGASLKPSHSANSPATPSQTKVETKPNPAPPRAKTPRTVPGSKAPGASIQPNQGLAATAPVVRPPVASLVNESAAPVKNAPAQRLPSAKASTPQSPTQASPPPAQDLGFDSSRSYQSSPAPLGRHMLAVLKWAIMAVSAGILLFIGLAAMQYGSMVILRIEDVIYDIPAENKVLEGHQKGVTDLAIDRTGKYLASSSLDGTVRVWNTYSGKETHCFKGHEGSVYSVAIAPDATIVLSGGEDDTVRVWDLSTGKLVWTLTGHKKDVLRLHIIHDKKYAVSGSTDGTVRVWDLSTGHEIRRFEHGGTISFSMAASEDGKHLAATNHDGLVKVWEIQTAKTPLTFNKTFRDFAPAITLDRRSTYLLAGNGSELDLWNIRLGRNIYHGVVSGSVTTVAMAEDWNYGAAGTQVGPIYILDILKQKHKWVLSGHEDAVNRILFAKNGKYLVSGSADKTVRVWDLQIGHEVRRFAGHENGVHRLVLAAGERYVISSSFYDKTIRMWYIGDVK